VIQGAFDLEKLTTAKIAADKAERKKEYAKWTPYLGIKGGPDEAGDWDPLQMAEGGIMSLKKKW
jgi:hypothetical protein